MKHSFTLGAVSGITALALGFPVSTQLAGAQSSTPSSAGTKHSPRWENRAPLSQDDVEAMINSDNQFLLHADALLSIHKKAVQNHRIALQAALDIEDDAARTEAVKAAHDAMRAEITAAIEADAELSTLSMIGHHGFGGSRNTLGSAKHRRMSPPAELLETLGVTAEEWRAARDEGKTIKEIAEENGVELPERHGRRWRR